jgi:hypothetical protein
VVSVRTTTTHRRMVTTAGGAKIHPSCHVININIIYI